MLCALTLATLLAVLPGAASGQELSVLHIKVTLTDAARASVPVAGHALLISDNPATSTPRRVVTRQDGTSDVRLRPGNYTVESDEPFAFGGKGYQWTETLDVPTGRDVVLELTAKNAEVGAAPPAPPLAAASLVNDASLRRQPSKDSAVTVWTPEARAPGFIVDAAGLVVTNQSVIGKEASAVEVQLSPSVKVAARVLAADEKRDIAVLWIDPAIVASAPPVLVGCADLSFDGACEVVKAAEKAMQSAPRPVATLLPVEPLKPFPADVLDATVKRRAGNLNPYQMSSSDFDIAFLTPVIVSGAQHNTQRDWDVRQLRKAAATDFGDWSDYFADVPPVLVIRVTPKLAESFWTTVARGAAYTQGAALPPITHFKPGFSRLHAFCGDVEVMPIHPFILQQRISETDAVREGLYVFDPQALGPHCKSVKLVLSSEKVAEKQDTRTVDPKLIERIWDDFAPYRDGRP